MHHGQKDIDEVVQVVQVLQTRSELFRAMVRQKHRPQRYQTLGSVPHWRIVELEQLANGVVMPAAHLPEAQGFPKACLEILQHGFHAMDDQSDPFVLP